MCEPLGKHTTLSQVYKLFGGSVAVGIPGNPANIFAYSGPRGLQARPGLAHTLRFATACTQFLHTLCPLPPHVHSIWLCSQAS